MLFGSALSDGCFPLLSTYSWMKPLKWRSSKISPIRKNFLWSPIKKWTASRSRFLSSEVSVKVPFNRRAVLEIQVQYGHAGQGSVSQATSCLSTPLIAFICQCRVLTVTTITLALNVSSLDNGWGRQSSNGQKEGKHNSSKEFWTQKFTFWSILAQGKKTFFNSPSLWEH